MSTLIEILQSMKHEIMYLEHIVYHDDSNTSMNYNYLPITEYQLRIKHSAPSIKYRVCCKCRINKPSRQFSNIDLHKGIGKSVCCNCIKKLCT